MAYQNFYATKTQNAIGASDTTIQVQTPPTVTSGRLVLEPRNAQLREIISFTGVTGTSLTGVTRGLFGTAPNPHTSGALVEMNFLAQDYQDLVDAFNTFAATNSSGWYNSVATITNVVPNGNRSYTLTTNTDQSALWTPGTRLKLTRTVSTPLQSTLLNGTTQYYNDTTVSGMNFTDDFAAGAWIKLNAYTSAADMNIITRFNGTSGWRLTLNSVGQLLLTGNNGGGTNFRFVISQQSIPLNKWTHVAVQLDMSTYTVSSTTCYVMIDGFEVASYLVTSGSNPTSLVQAGNLEVGSVNGGGSPFPGKIAQAWVTSAKITPTAVRTLMTQGITPALITANNIISAYSFSNSINDLNTTNANNLAAQGSAVATNNDAPWGQQANGTLSATVDYAIVSAISGTSVTVQVPEGSTIPASGGIASLQYSNTKAPFGMPIQKEKWRIESVTLGESLAANVTTFTNIGGSQLTVNLGAWTIGYSGSTFAERGVADGFSVFMTLATIPNGETDRTMTALAASAKSVVVIAGFATREKGYTLTTPTTYYLNRRANIINDNVYNNASETGTIVYADNAYL